MNSALGWRIQGLVTLAERFDTLPALRWTAARRTACAVWDGGGATPHVPDCWRLVGSEAQYKPSAEALGDIDAGSRPNCSESMQRLTMRW